MSTFQLASTFYMEDCIYAGCGVTFAVTREFNKRRRNDGKSFYCPNGHSMVYGQDASDEQKLRDSEARETALKDQLEAAVRDGEATRVALLRDRARFAKGVCPCCNRSFENVRRHMETKHADYDITKVKQAVSYKCGCGRSFDSFHGLRVHQGYARSERWAEPGQSRWSSHLTAVK